MILVGGGAFVNQVNPENTSVQLLAELMNKTSDSTRLVGALVTEIVTIVLVSNLTL